MFMSEQSLASPEPSSELESPVHGTPDDPLSPNIESNQAANPPKRHKLPFAPLEIEGERGLDFAGDICCQVARGSIFPKGRLRKPRAALSVRWGERLKRQADGEPEAPKTRPSFASSELLETQGVLLVCLVVVFVCFLFWRGRGGRGLVFEVVPFF